MKMFFILMAVAAIAALCVFFYIKKRKEPRVDVPKNLSLAPGKSQVLSSKSEAVAQAQTGWDSESPTLETVVDPVAEVLLGSVEEGVLSPVLEEVLSPAVESERQSEKTASDQTQPFRLETVPEDSVLRRHYLSTKQAEREAITNPYPTDSALRRHYQSLSAINLHQAVVAESVKTMELVQACGQAAKRTPIPEDATLRRHFLTQVQAEVEALLTPRPTDSTLRRHYDALIKTRVEEYLNGCAV